MVFNLTIPSAAVGLCAVVPTGTLMASVAEISNETEGELLLTPILAPTSKLIVVRVVPVMSRLYEGALVLIPILPE